MITADGSQGVIRCPDCGYVNIAGTEDCESCSAPLAPLASPQPRKGLSAKILAGTLADLKPREAVTVSPEDRVSDAVRRMREHKIGCALVTEEGGVVGIMTERDLLFAVAGLKDPAHVEVREVMQADPVCLKEDDPINYAFHHMSVGGYRHLPVYRSDGSVGVVSARDLLRYLSPGS